MTNFVTFDDGLSYMSILRIDSFSLQQDGVNKGMTCIRLKDGQVIYSQLDVSKVAELLGPCVNLSC